MRSLAMSALSPKADNERTCRHVRFVPKADISNAANQQLRRYQVTLAVPYPRMKVGSRALDTRL
jgi:hypothetical protein